MPNLPKNLIDEMLLYYEKQKESSAYYKGKNNLEMEYLVEWTILEKFTKEISAQYRKFKLKNELEEWIIYLEKGCSAKKPNKINSFTIESVSLPREQDLKEALNYYGFDSNKVWAVMSSNGSHRKYRNKLAHNGEAISESKFNSLFPELESLVDYFLHRLRY